MVSKTEIIPLIESAVAARSSLIDAGHTSALRLFNGFSEGCPGLVIDLYGRTLVFFNQHDPPAEIKPLIQPAQDWLLAHFDWLQAVIIKTRHTDDEQMRRGVLVFGSQPDREINEHGVRYALDLCLNQDASFYLDTRNLRDWLRRTMHGKIVLNTFAYTGSLGVAALVGGAARVVQVDLVPRFLKLARQSSELNGFRATAADLIDDDYFHQVARFKRQGFLFDCVIHDPPFFSITRAGRVDLVNEYERLINKVRPVVADNGWLVAVNNALFVSGRDYLNLLESICSSGYLQLEEIIPVPLDVTGYPETIQELHYPVDPAPFNHPTKIAILRVRRKDQATSAGRI